jgi:pimeloyl-ACP methyl ester carboxylesterase
MSPARPNPVLVHGVPDTPAVWGPLLAALGIEAERPRLPGFGDALPVGFTAKKDGYAAWLADRIAAHCAKTGPVDLVGHDWGALLVLRVASLRPDLVRSWAVSGAVLDPDYRGHSIARIWNTPLLGEAFMALTPRSAMRRSFVRSGLGDDLAHEEAEAWTATMRRSILSLYRSAEGLRFGGDWIARLADLPRHGLVIWGDRDPYVSLAVAERFTATHRVPLHLETGAGHWAIAERAAPIAACLRAHWAAIH